MESIWPFPVCGMGDLVNGTCVCHEGWTTEGAPIFDNIVLCDQHAEMFKTIWSSLRGGFVFYLASFLIMYSQGQSNGSVIKKVKKSVPNIVSCLLLIMVSQWKLMGISTRFLGVDEVMTISICVVFALAQLIIRIDFIKYVDFVETNTPTQTRTTSYSVKTRYKVLGLSLFSIPYVFITVGVSIGSILVERIGALFFAVVLLCSIAEGMYIMKSALNRLQSITRFANSIEMLEDQPDMNHITQAGITQAKTIEKLLKLRFMNFTIAFIFYFVVVLLIGVWPIMTRQTKFAFPAFLFVHMISLYVSLISAFTKRRSKKIFAESVYQVHQKRFKSIGSKSSA